MTNNTSNSNSDYTQILHSKIQDICFSIGRKIYVSSSLFKLITAQYWKSKSEMFFMFIFSIVFIAVFGYVFAAQTGYSGEAFMVSLSGIFLLEAIQGGMQSMPTAIMEFKTSVLLKRIGATPIKPYMFVLTATSFYFVAVILQIFWMLLWILIIFSSQQFTIIDNSVPTAIDGFNLIFGANSTVDWGGYSFTLFYGIILSIFIGIFISSISKSATSSQAIGMIFFFVNMLLAGLLLPLNFVNQLQGLRVISYFAPFRYVSALSGISFTGGNIFDPNAITAQTTGLGLENYDPWLNLFMPLILMGILMFFAVRFFKWNVR